MPTLRFHWSVNDIYLSNMWVYRFPILETMKIIHSGGQTFSPKMICCGFNIFKTDSVRKKQSTNILMLMFTYLHLYVIYRYFVHKFTDYLHVKQNLKLNNYRLFVHMTIKFYGSESRLSYSLATNWQKYVHNTA